MGWLYRIEYKDFNNDDTLIIIDKAGYSGGVIDLEPAGNPLTYHLPDGNTIFEPIQGSGCTITVHGKDSDNLRQLFSGKFKDYSVTIRKNNLPVFFGWLESELYEEDFSSTIFEFTITVSDGLSLLKRRRFSTGDIFSVEKTSTVLAAVCNELLVTKVAFSDELTFDLGNPQTETVFDHLRVRYDNYYTEELEAESLYDILSWLMTATGCVAFREYDTLYIINPIYNPDIRLYNNYNVVGNDLVKSNSEWVQKVSAIDSDLRWIAGNQKLDIEPARNYQEIPYNGYSNLDLLNSAQWDDQTQSDPVDPAGAIDINVVAYDRHFRDEFALDDNGIQIPQSISEWETLNGHKVWAITEQLEESFNTTKIWDEYKVWFKVIPNMSSLSKIYGYYGYYAIYGNRSVAYRTTKNIRLHTHRDPSEKSGQVVRISGDVYLGHGYAGNTGGAGPEMYYNGNVPIAPFVFLILRIKLIADGSTYYLRNLTQSYNTDPTWLEDTGSLSEDDKLCAILLHDKGNNIIETTTSFTFDAPPKGGDCTIEILDSVAEFTNDGIISDIYNKVNSVHFKDIKVVIASTVGDDLTKDFRYEGTIEEADDGDDYKDEAPAITTRHGDSSWYASGDNFGGNIAHRGAFLTLDGYSLADKFHRRGFPAEVNPLGYVLLEFYGSQYALRRFKLQGTVDSISTTENFVFSGDGTMPLINKRRVITDPNLPGKYFYVLSGNYDDASCVCSLNVIEISPYPYTPLP
jgi:hypothetical protein